MYWARRAFVCGLPGNIASIGKITSHNITPPIPKLAKLMAVASKRQP
jgi:hypothetical protein